jgi:hypothetical protein
MLPLVKIIDFNVSKIHSIEQIQEITKLFGSLDLGRERANKTRYAMLTKTGTPLYTAPEMQIAGKYS